MSDHASESPVTSAILAALQPFLTKNTQAHVCVGLSGGADSLSLLHALQSLRSDYPLTVRALHINHGLQADADDWEFRCAEYCEQWRLELSVQRLQLGSAPISEDSARQARYKVFQQQLQPGEVLLLGHHLDDQLETLLLRLCRGAGIQGLAGIPPQRELGDGQLLRPFLNLTRATIESYARDAGLCWVEDGSNAELHYDRNFIRHEVLARIESRWPAYRESWGKSMRLLTEQAVMNEQMAVMDIHAAALEDGAALSLTSLQALAPERRRSALGFWLRERTGQSAGWAVLQRLDQACERPPRQAAVLLEGNEFSVQFSSKPVAGLYLLRELPRAMAPTRQLKLEIGEQLVLPDNGRLRVVAANPDDAGLAAGRAQCLTVAYRSGGEQCQLPGRPRRSLKKLLQESPVPLWQRERLPILLAGEELAYLPGFGPTAAFAASPASSGLRIDWEQPVFLY